MSVRPTALQVLSIEQWAKLYGTSFDVACGRPVDTFQQPAPLPSDGHFPAAHGSGRSCLEHLRPQRRKGGTYAEQGHNWVYHREDHHDDHNCQKSRQHHHDDW